MLLTDEVRGIAVRLSHPSKTRIPSEVILSQPVTDVRAVEPANTLSPSAVIVSGRVTFFSVVEEIKAHAGIDIGGTLIGMHLKRVCVPVRLGVNKIGEANIICAKTRPKLIGGERAVYEVIDKTTDL